MDDILDINKKVALELFSVYEYKEPLQFPKLRNNVMRISEQESKICFTYILFKEKINFSVETPTLNTYSFTGNNDLSARIDITIYNKENREYNVEFKAHNPAQKSISKDFEKLIKETKKGNWFHTFKNINSSTLKRLIEKFNNSIQDTATTDCSKEDLLVFIAILDLKCILYYKLANTSGEIPVFEYKIKRGNFICNNLNGWICQFVSADNNSFTVEQVCTSLAYN